MKRKGNSQERYDGFHGQFRIVDVESLAPELVERVFSILHTKSSLCHSRYNICNGTYSVTLL